MPEFNLAITISSFVAGMLTFFAPCTLPLLPAFLGIISGVKGSGLLSEGDWTPYSWQIFKNAVFYVFGFSLVFILFGVSFTFITSVLGLKDWLERLGGVFVILFGLVIIGWFKIPFLSSEKKLAVSRLFQHSSFFNSFLLGALFALGWSPCVGPLLGSVLLLASTSGTVLEGTFLLVVFSVGLGIPFLITALLIGKAFVVFKNWSKVISAINKVAGFFLLLIGFLLVIGQFTPILNQFKAYFYRFYFFEVFLNKFL